MKATCAGSASRRARPSWCSSPDRRLPEQEALLARLGKHRTGKCCLYIKRLSDVDEAVLEELIVEALAYMDEKYPR